MRADLALVGFGNVGRRFAHLLDERRRLLTDDHDLDCRIMGIATARHGAVFNPSGLDAVAAATTIGAGGTLSDLPAGNQTTAVGNAIALIGCLERSSASLRVVVETTTLNIKDGRPALDHVEAALECGTSCRDGEQGAGGLRLSNACAVWRREPGSRFCSRARSWTVFRFSILSVKRCPESG